jgi:hypothetical protein
LLHRRELQSRANNGPEQVQQGLAKARQMAAHASTRTTQLYDRREDSV